MHIVLTLATVLTILLTHPHLQEEKRKTLSGWIKALTCALQEKLGDASNAVFLGGKDTVAHKLIALSKILGRDPYDTKGQLCGKLKDI
jgi:hypothetical protein